MTLDEMLPGAGKSIRAIAVLAVALLVAAYVAGHCAGAASVDTSTLEKAMKHAKDSIQALERDRAHYVGEAAAARVEAAQAKQEREAAVAHADTLATAAERHRTFRLRVIDSTHVATTASDTDHVEEVATVPVEVTVQLRLDSMALQAQDIALDKFNRENVALERENLKLWQAVTADSAEFRQKDALISDLTKLKSPSRFGFKSGAVAAVAVIALVRFLLGGRL